jgi:BASS family bile acid:Na+ symporter
MLQRFLLIWLILSSTVALLWPRIGLQFDPFLLAGGDGIHGLIVVVMFCIGTLLATEEVDALYKRWPTVIVGTTIQYVSMPLLAWIMIQIFQPSPQIAAGIMIVGCVPGAMASNVLTLAARGNVSYSVSLTTCATLLSPFVVPWILNFTISDDVNYDGNAAVLMLVLTVVLPVISGHLLRRRVRGDFERATGMLQAVANLAILGIIAIAIAIKRNELQEITWSLLGILAAINMGGYLAGYFGGAVAKIPEPMRRALTLEVGMQNAGAGTALAIHLFGESSPATIPCVLYTFGCMLTGTVLATIWRNFVPDEEASEQPTAE